MRKTAPPPVPIEDFYALRWGAIWKHFKSEPFSFWMACGYLFVEYVRPQSIIPALDILPWAQVFIALTLFGCLSDKTIKFVSDSTHLWMTLFLLVIIVSSWNAVYPAVSWSHFNDFFSWFIIYFLIVHVVNTEKRFLIFLAIFLIASFKLSFSSAKTWSMRGFGFTNWGLMGPPGFFQNSGELSVQMLMFGPVAYQLTLFMKPYLSRLKYNVMMLLPVTASMTVIGASSRGAQIGLVYQMYRCLLKGKVTFKKLAVIAIVVYAGFALLPQEQKDRFSSAGTDNTSQQRLLYWKHGREIIREHPVLGIGYFNFSDYYDAHYSYDLLFPHAELPHNIFVQVGTDAGFIGLFVFLMLIYRTGKTARDIRKMVTRINEPKPYLALTNGFMIAMWGFLIAGQFVTITYYPFFWINLAFMVALKNIVHQQYELQSSGVPTKRKI